MKRPTYRMNWQTNQPTDGPSLLERCNDAYKGDNLPHLLSEKLSSSCEPCFGQQLESLPTISLAFPWTKASSIIATTFVESFSSSTRKKNWEKLNSSCSQKPSPISADRTLGFYASVLTEMPGISPFVTVAYIPGKLLQRQNIETIFCHIGILLKRT